jgi:hypothetical protein
MACMVQWISPFLCCAFVNVLPYRLFGQYNSGSEYPSTVYRQNRACSVMKNPGITGKCGERGIRMAGPCPPWRVYLATPVPGTPPYFTMKLSRSSVLRFFSFRSSIMAWPRLSFSRNNIMRHGLYGAVDFSIPLLCLCKRSVVSAVWPI